jgi:hypothetical protein
MFSAVDDDHFRHFAVALETALSVHDENEEKPDLYRRLMEDLLVLEADFKKRLIDSQHGVEVYEAFIYFICKVQRNILDARPYFREASETFSDHISDALKLKDPKRLWAFRINFEFISFVMSTGHFGERSKLRKIAAKIGKLRQEILVALLPLAVNRARVFYRSTPKSHLQHMDTIQIEAVGFMNGIDKYCPEADGSIHVRKFKSCVMGRGGGDLINEYSQTLLHFYPADKRVLYRAHSATRFHTTGAVDYEKLTETVNEGVEKPTHQTNPADLADLMAAASTVSADSSLPSDPDAPEPIERFAAPESTRPDVQVEANDSMNLLLRAFSRLNPYEQKFLRLKGVRFAEQSILLFDERSISMG